MNFFSVIKPRGVRSGFSCRNEIIGLVRHEVRSPWRKKLKPNCKSEPGSQLQLLLSSRGSLCMFTFFW